MLRDLDHPFAGGEPVYDVTFENVQAGLRTDYLFRLANQRGGIVLGTGDLSELALGWCTYGVGDQMSHYNVNAGVPKTLIQHLIRWVIVVGAVRRTRSATVLHRRSSTPRSPPSSCPVERRRRQAAEHRGDDRAVRAAGLHAVPRAALRLPPRRRSRSWPSTPGRDADARRLAARLPGRRARRAYDLPTIRHWLEVFAAALLRVQPVQALGDAERAEGRRRRLAVAARRLARAVGPVGPDLAGRDRQDPHPLTAARGRSGGGQHDDGAGAAVAVAHQGEDVPVGGEDALDARHARRAKRTAVCEVGRLARVGVAARERHGHGLVQRERQRRRRRPAPPGCGPAVSVNGPTRGAAQRREVPADARARHRGRAPARGRRCPTSTRPRRPDVRGRAHGQHVERRHRDRARRPASTSSPARTRAYARRPSTLIALTALGTCSIAPVRAATPAAIAASVTPAGSAVPTTSPSASSVVVATPEPDRRRVGLRVEHEVAQQLVPRSTPKTSTPVAIGSSVPAWPTLRVRRIRRIRATTSWLVSPAGLSTITSPASTRRFSRSPRAMIATSPTLPGFDHRRRRSRGDHEAGVTPGAHRPPRTLQADGQQAHQHERGEPRPDPGRAPSRTPATPRSAAGTRRRAATSVRCAGTRRRRRRSARRRARTPRPASGCIAAKNHQATGRRRAPRVGGEQPGAARRYSAANSTPNPIAAAPARSASPGRPSARARSASPAAERRADQRLRRDRDGVEHQRA